MNDLADGWVNNVAGDTPEITRRLVERGHSDEVILTILGGNFLRVFQKVWKA